MYKSISPWRRKKKKKATSSASGYRRRPPPCRRWSSPLPSKPSNWTFFLLSANVQNGKWCVGALRLRHGLLCGHLVTRHERSMHGHTGINVTCQNMPYDALTRARPEAKALKLILRVRMCLHPSSMVCFGHWNRPVAILLEYKHGARKNVEGRPALFAHCVKPLCNLLENLRPRGGRGRKPTAHRTYAWRGREKRPNRG
jgi:hypothetical protein